MNFVGAFTGVLAMSLAIWWRWVVNSNIPDSISLGFGIGGAALVMMHFQAFFPGVWWALALRAVAYIGLLAWIIWMTWFLHRTFDQDTLTDIGPK